MMRSWSINVYHSLLSKEQIFMAGGFYDGPPGVGGYSKAGKILDLESNAWWDAGDMPDDNPVTNQSL